MIAPLALVAGLLCAQAAATTPPDVPGAAEDAPSPRAAASRIVAVTVYHGEALVTREVAVPEGGGTVEVVVTPLPAEVRESSLFAEGGDGLRVLSTRFRARAVREDARGAIRALEEQVRKLTQEAERLTWEIAVQAEDLQYLGKLEGFAGTSLKAQVERGTLDDKGIINLSNFVMERRALKAKAEVDLRQQLQATTASVESARKQLAGLAASPGRVERDAVILVGKARPEGGTIRIGYLVGAAGWQPQYRLRGAADAAAPVRLEYLAALTQQSGEAWSGARITLSTARPALDATPPDLLPLKMAIAGHGKDPNPGGGDDGQAERIELELNKRIDMPFPLDTPLSDVVRYVRQSTSGPAFPDGIPIYVDPQALQDADKTLASTLNIDLKGIPLRTTLRLALAQLNLIYEVKDGLLTITTSQAAHGNEDDPNAGIATMGGMGGGMGLVLEQSRAAGAAQLNRAAAGTQAEELRAGDAPNPAALGSDQAGPSVSFTLPDPVDVPSRRDPLLFEVGRVELPAEAYARATPILTPRVYRLALVTNRSDLTLLPGPATVYVGAEFVGRMQLPLVAAGEAFTVGFGVDPQLQVSRRLVAKSRVIQGGNQVLTYEFRLNLRNYRNSPMKVQLWDRFPVAQGEAVPVSLTRTSLPLSTDPTYEKTARADNLLRWDLDLPAGTGGDKPLSLAYEFRLEYARNLPPPRFLSGGLGEAPIGGPTAGGMGAMGGFQSIRPSDR